MPKGQKFCDKCGTATGPRAFVCKNCNHQFAFKAKSREQKNTKIIRDINWKELVKGDKIKVSGGPYFVFKGEFIPMGYRGRFIVEKIDEKGICAWGIDKQSGFVHIYMGKDIQNRDTGIWKVKHKIVKIKRKESKNVESATMAAT
jgi:ribosomal protein L40E